MILEIWSDPSCPWCWIGKRRLEKALAGVAQGARPAIVWRAFLLNPDLPEDGMERNAYLARKFGSARIVGTFLDRIAGAGLEEGLPLAFESISRTPSTRLAQRIVVRSREAGLQDDVVEALFRAYFTRGQNIGEMRTLVDVVCDAGIDRARALSWLEDGSVDDPVLADLRRAAALGIRSIPYFVFDRRYAVAGAQSPESLQLLLGLAGDRGQC